MKWGTEWPDKHDLSSLRLLGSVGEPINPEAWIWYHKNIGGGRCPDRRHVVADRDGRDHDHAAARASRRRGRARRRVPSRASRRRSSTRRATRSRSAAATSRSRGRGPRCCGRSGATTSATSKTYWSRVGPDVYFPGDGARRDKDGYFWLLGRVDDVMNVAGHRIGTMEVESALVDHPAVRRGRGRRRHRRDEGDGDRGVRHPEGEGQDAARRRSRDRAQQELAAHVAKKIGAIARPGQALLHRDLPKTRSRKDHAPPAARHRRGPRPRRHDDARRPDASSRRSRSSTRRRRADPSCDAAPRASFRSYQSGSRVSNNLAVGPPIAFWTACSRPT